MPSAPDSQVREVDLSMEWDSLSSAPAGASTNSVVEEIDFYLQADLPAEAQESISKLRGLDPNHSSLEDFQRRLDIMLGRGAAVAEVTMPDWGAAPASEASSVPSAEESSAASPAISEPSVEPEFSPAFSMMSAPEPAVEAEPVSFAAPIQEPLAASSPAAQAPAQALSDAELDLEHISSGVASSGNGFELALDDHSAPAATSSTAAPPPAVSSGAAASAGSGLLDDLFAEFRDEVETPQPGGGDLETHYNMGVAFKEMALYDEAIGEFQKVQQIAEQAKDYSHVIQCCSLLALCFIEKGLPLLAVNWYQTALKSPGVDADSSLALLYEMGSAYEMAGDRQAALKSFMDVYSRNIDYRNVSERIRDLQQAS